MDNKETMSEDREGMPEASNETMGGGNMNQGGAVPPEGGDDKSYGPLVGIVIIVIVLILGGLYLWNQKTPNVDDLDPGSDEVIGGLQTQGSSDAIEDIEQDLEATELESLDDDLNAIEQELQNI